VGGALLDGLGMSRELDRDPALSRARLGSIDRTLGARSQPRAADVRPAMKCWCETQTAIRAASSQRSVRT
jgi:hypothetical protein